MRQVPFPNPLCSKGVRSQETAQKEMSAVTQYPLHVCLQSED